MIDTNKTGINKASLVFREAVRAAAEQGILDAITDIHMKSIKDDEDFSDVLPKTEKEIKLSDMEKKVLILIATGSQTYFQGSKNKKTKLRQMTDAGRQLSYEGLITFRIRGNGYEGEITEKGKALANTFSSSEVNEVTRLSEGQYNRQNERVNGQYSEMNTCDYCEKRRAVVYADDEGDRDIICDICSRKRDNGEEI